MHANSDDDQVYWSSRVEGDPEWVEDLIRVLRDPPESAAMLLTDIAAEIVAWIDDASTTSWNRNARGLLEEFHRSYEQLPPHLRRLLGPPLNRTKKTSTLALRADSTAGDRAALREALSALVAALASAEATEIAWDVLITALRDAPGSLDDARRAIAGLYAVNQAFGAGEQMRLKRAEGHLVGSNMELHFSDPPADPPALDERLRNAGAALVLSDQPEGCVAWISMDRVSLPSTTWSYGPITLYPYNWAVPNAQDDDGQAFAHRDELRELMRYRALLIGEAEIPPHLALARIELPGTPPSIGLDVAAEHLRVLWQTASPRGAPRWIIGEQMALLVDGKYRGGSWHRRSSEDDISPYSIRRAGELFV